MQLGVARSLERWAATWARRRQGADAHAIALKRRRIYILPTRFGIVFGVMVFAMLLGSLNYGASLGFTLTFLLTGVGLVVMHHCHNNLLGTTIKFLGAAPVFAGERAEFKIAVCNDVGSGALRDRAQLPRPHARGPSTSRAAARRSCGSACRPSVAAGSRSSASESRRATPRACSALGRGCTWTRAASCIRAPPIPAGRCPTAVAAASKRTQHAGDDDFAGLRSAAPGDPPQRIAWKAYARNDRPAVEGVLERRRRTVPARLGTAARARRRAAARPARPLVPRRRRCRPRPRAAPAGQNPSRSGQGPKHLAACLEALALFDAGLDTRGGAMQRAVAEAPR